MMHDTKLLFAECMPELDLNKASYDYPTLLAFHVFEKGIEEGIKIGVEKQKLRTSQLLNSLLNPF